MSHTVATKVEILEAGAVLWEGYVSDGNIGFDNNDKYYRKGKITINSDDRDLIPGVKESFLSPFGTELRLSRGIKYPDGTTELIPMGYFIMTKTRAVDSGQGLQLLVDADDRSVKVDRARFESTYSVAKSTNIGTAIMNIIQLRAPWADFSVDLSTLTDATSPGQVFEQGDNPWQACYKMAEDIGFRLYFNQYGEVAMREKPSTLGVGTYAWEFIDGEDGNLLYIDREFTVEATYNKMVVVGEPKDSAAVSGSAEDDDPTSPTYVDGPFGVVPRFYSSPFINTTAQATATAKKMLVEHLGSQENLHIQALPMVALEPTDFVWVRRTRIGVETGYHVSKVTVPMVHDRAMDVQMHTERVR